MICGHVLEELVVTVNIAKSFFSCKPSNPAHTIAAPRATRYATHPPQYPQRIGT